MADIEKLHRAIQHFENNSRPLSFSETKPATLADINRVRKSIVTVLTTFVDELEQK